MNTQEMNAKIKEYEEEISKLKRRAYMLEAVKDIRKYGFNIGIRNETMNTYNKKYTKIADLLPKEIVEEIKDFVCEKLIQYYELDGELK